MQITTRHTPSFGVARCALGPNEPVKIEAGAMMAMAGVVLEAKAEGGILKSLKRAALGGESFFVTTAHASPQGGWIDVAARLPGDLMSVELDGQRGLFVSKGSWLASAASVTLDTQWGGFKNFFGSEGGFILRTTGAGPIVLACYGALEVWNLEPGQMITVDTGHMVAYDESVTMSLRKATGGIVQSFKSGEGIVFDFTGPGRVWLQSRNPNEFLSFIQAAVGTSGGGGGASPLGLFTRD